MDGESYQSQRCPQCGAAFDVPLDKVGDWQYCPACRDNLHRLPSSNDSHPPTGTEDSGRPEKRGAPEPPSALESDTYALSSGRLESIEAEARSRNPDDVWPKVVPPPPINQRRRKSESSKSLPWWSGLGKALAVVLGIQVIGIVLTLIFPSLILTLFGVYLLALVVMFGMSWMIGLQHALQNNRASIIFFFLIPLYPVRYGIRHWPETRPAVTAIGLAFIWMTAPILISMPISIVGSFFEKREPEPVAEAAPAAPNVPAPKPWQNPVSPDSSKPPAQAPSVLMSRPQSITSPANPPIVVGAGLATAPDGTMTITITKSDGTTSKSVRHSKSTFEVTSEEKRRRIDLWRKIGRLGDQRGKVIVADVIGTDSEVITGGKDGIYAIGSSPNAAAVHAGLVNVDEKVKVKITIVPNVTEFPSLEQNGVLSLPALYTPQSGFKIERAMDDESPEQ